MTSLGKRTLKKKKTKRIEQEEGAWEATALLNKVVGLAENVTWSRYLKDWSE